MKPETPPANIIIGIIYLAVLAATFYLLKLVLKPTSSDKKNEKFNTSNYAKGLQSPTISQ